MSLRHLLPLLPALCLLACGEKDEDDDGDDGDGGGSGVECSAQISASGALEADISHGPDEGCSGSGAGDAASFSWGINGGTTVFLWVNSGVDAQAESQTGLWGTVGLMDEDFNEWQSTSDACAVEFTSIEQDPDWEGSWWFTGTATCSEPLVADDGSETTVGVLTFTGSAPFPE